VVCEGGLTGTFAVLWRIMYMSPEDNGPGLLRFLLL
jgi:hypothetical protein